MNPLSRHKTRIVCTIGPASQGRSTLERMIKNGMEVARLNLAHGDYESHRSTIAAVRESASRLGRRVTLLADLPGPKLRVGCLPDDVVQLKRGQLVRIVGQGATTSGLGTRADPEIFDIPITLESLPETLSNGHDVFLNDGLIQLRVQGEVGGSETQARVIVGGELRTRDGISLPGVDLGICAFTMRDRELLAFAIEQGVDAVAVSFVQGPDDILAMRGAAASMAYTPFVIAKIERAQAVEHIDAILGVSDGLMVARGDLGVEIPLEEVAVAQKLLIGRANEAGRPVITATQMLESMTENRRPTRAEVTDVSNAVLDGTDCVMLSEETAMGMFPVDAVAVMAKVVSTTERRLPGTHRPRSDDTCVRGVLAQAAVAMADRLNARYILVPTETGTTARAVARLRPHAWIVAFSPYHDTCQRLQFSRGVHPVLVSEDPGRSVNRSGNLGAAARGLGKSPPQVGAQRIAPDCGELSWHPIARRWISTQGLKPGLAVMIQSNNRLEVLDLTQPEPATAPAVSSTPPGARP